MARAVAESLVLHPQVPRAAAEESWVVATDLAEELARNGVPFHRAHQIVGQLVLESVKSGKRAADWDGPSLAAFAPEFKAEMARLLSPVEGMKSRELPGGTGPQAVAKALDEAERRLLALSERAGAA
jgi:argininosuccinate lyase